MNYKIDYLLKYISNETYKKIINDKGEYLLEELENNQVDVDLNIRYLIKYGIKNIDNVIYERLEELVLNTHEFTKKIEQYEKNLGKDGFISMIENV